MKFIRSYLTFLLLVGTAFQLAAQTDYDEMLKGYYKGTVPTISSAELLKKIEKGTKLHLLDTRTKKEYGVSTIKGAVRFGTSFSSKKMAEVGKDDLIVVYCTIGARSENVGKKIKDAGYSNVYNLYGGIISWVNEGNSVYQGTEETDQVHVYGKEWGKWLKKGKPVY